MTAPREGVGIMKPFAFGPASSRDSTSSPCPTETSPTRSRQTWRNAEPRGTEWGPAPPTINPTTADVTAMHRLGGDAATEGDGRLATGGRYGLTSGEWRTGRRDGQGPEP